MGGVCTFSRFGNATTRALKIVAVDFEPRHRILALRDIAGFEHHGVLVHFILERDFLADTHQIRRDVDLLSIDADVAVEDNLPRLGTRTGKAGPPDGIVETTLEHDDKIFSGGPLRAFGFFDVVAELPLQQPVGALHLLLFAQLQPVPGQLLHAARLAVLPRNKVTLFDGALLGKTAQPL